jgi:hypothetical protein
MGSLCGCGVRLELGERAVERPGDAMDAHGLARTLPPRAGGAVQIRGRAGASARSTPSAPEAKIGTRHAAVGRVARLASRGCSEKRGRIRGAPVARGQRRPHAVVDGSASEGGCPSRRAAAGRAVHEQGATPSAADPPAPTALVRPRHARRPASSWRASSQHLFGPGVPRSRAASWRAPPRRQSASASSAWALLVLGAALLEPPGPGGWSRARAG